MTSPPRPDTVPTGGPWRGAFELIASIVTPVSLITAALYYFGWVRSDAIARVFGYDVNVLGLTTQDYLLRSVTPMFLPITSGFATAIALAALGRWLRDGVERGAVLAGRADAVARVLMVVGATAILAGVVAVPSERADRLYLVMALLLGGAVTAGFGLLIRQAAAAQATDQPLGPPVVVLVALIVIGLAGLFAGVTRYADQVGVGRARQTITDLERLGDVILYSDRALHIDGGGSRCVLLPGDDAGLRYRYDGLKLFTQADGRLLLLPVGYGRDGVAELFVVPVTDGVRMDISRAALLGGAPPPHPSGAAPCA